MAMEASGYCMQLHDGCIYSVEHSPWIYLWSNLNTHSKGMRELPGHVI